MMSTEVMSRGPLAASREIINVTGWDVLARVLETHVPSALKIDKYVTPVWCVIGILGNVFSAKVWALRRMRKCNSSALYLVSLAITDITFLVLHVFYELQYPWKKGVLDLPVWCPVWNVMYMMSQYTCVFLVMTFTCERFLSVCHPFESDTLSSSSRPPKIILSMLLLALLLALPQAYFWEINPGNRECQLRTKETIETFYLVWNWSSEMAMFAVVPVVVLVLNICVLRQIKSVRKQFIDDVVIRNKTVRCATTTFTLLCISFYLIFTKLPVTIVFAVQTNMQLGRAMTIDDMATDDAWQAYFNYFLIRKIVEEIGISHHACNVFIYYATSHLFRKHSKEAVHWRMCDYVNRPTRQRRSGRCTDRCFVK
ncbi:lysophosphatidic acid receptor 6-like [Gigantopelta aegis]|uniref:lysophosphatidic acid receptor 6-like n=1 Tax=Gigantopelta aegis TaxID=1735272 RepID=UPI001B88DF17|nr:lysophosphatidic acid receptor 6-like [Gigantopelta aegis]